MSHSELTKQRIGDALRKPIYFNCQYCGIKAFDKPSAYAKNKRHYCSNKCYALDRKENWEPEEQASWKGGVTPYEAHRRWAAKNKERMSHLKARHYARRQNAEGSHTLEEWQALKEAHSSLCAFCKLPKTLTKDHIIPISEGGSDYITNIQPLCRNCNSRKWKTLDYIYQNPELLNGK